MTKAQTQTSDPIIRTVGQRPARMIGVLCLVLIALLPFSAHLHAQCLAPSSLSPTSGSFSSAPTFSFYCNSTGCYLLVISNNSASCSTNGSGSDVVHSFGNLTAGATGTYAPSMTEWNGLSSGTLYWHVDLNCSGPCQPPYVEAHSTCYTITKTCSLPSGSVTQVSPCGGVTVTTRTPTLTWNGSYGTGTYYHVQLSTSSNFGSIAAESSSLTYLNQNCTVNTSLNDNSTYYWRIRAEAVCDRTVYSSWVGPCSFSINQAASVPLSSSTTGVLTILDALPNPTKSSMTVNLQIAAGYQNDGVLEVYNALGNLLDTHPLIFSNYQEHESVMISLGGPPGPRYLRVTSNSGASTVRVLVEH